MTKAEAEREFLEWLRAEGYHKSYERHIDIILAFAAHVLKLAAKECEKAVEELCEKGEHRAAIVAAICAALVRALIGE